MSAARWDCLIEPQSHDLLLLQFHVVSLWELSQLSSFHTTRRDKFHNLPSSSHYYFSTTCVCEAQRDDPLGGTA
ncbi:hypothetical protein EUGRSUZ_G01511 [Eucalyptus grandis]|uniref:Uncharacterized protein n=2 Tax=Eucalyptus grandis TaxID=71139 RepID=A0ACC3K352_EUCGR|nr:hypothetical protein EUGRSUZ_G01511 [Eucalyptus grandis]